MEKIKKDIESFFNQYEERVNNALSGKKVDTKGVINSFTDSFIESSPVGVICGKNGKEFGEQIKKGYEAYKKIGITAMDILTKEVIILDDFHAMAKIYWKSSYQKKDKTTGEIKFEVLYFLQTKDRNYKIFAFITGDEEKVLKEHGLV